MNQLDHNDLVDYLLKRLQDLSRFRISADVHARANELAQLARRLDLTDELVRRGAPIEP